MNTLRRRIPDFGKAVCGVLLLLFFAAALAGCGKRGNPTPPPGEHGVFPRTYPSE